MKYYLKDVPKSIRDKWTPYIVRDISYFSFLTEKNPPKYTIIHKNEMNASYDNKLDAIIIDDKLLTSLTPQEVKFCIGHEMGHREMFLNSNYKENHKNLSSLKKQWLKEVHRKFKKLIIGSDATIITILMGFLVYLLLYYVDKPSTTALLSCAELIIFMIIIIPMLVKFFGRVVREDEKNTLKYSYPSSIAKVLQSEEYNADKIGVLLTDNKSNAIKTLEKLGKYEEKVIPKKNKFFRFIDKFIYIQAPDSHPSTSKRIQNVKSMNL